MSYDQRFVSEFLSDMLYKPFEFPIEAVMGNTWAYPFIGIYYFLTRPSLWGPVFPIIIPQILITTFVFIFCHIWFYPPQAIVAVFFNGPTGLITSWIAILQQSGIISRFIIEKTILAKPLIEIFDSVLIQNGSEALTKKVFDLKSQEKKQLEIDSKKPPTDYYRDLLTKSYNGWLFYIRNPYYWIKFFTIIFFNLIPFFGPYILIFLRSPGKARNLHSRYYKLKKMNNEDISIFFNANRAYYSSFGIIALNLELIPVIGMFFTFTNIVAAALWASQLEKEIEKKIEVNQLK